MPEVFTPQAATDQTTANNVLKYDTAIENRDPKALLAVAQDTHGTPMSDVALEAAKKVDEKNRHFQSVIAPLEAKGGGSTPEGRVEAVNIWRNNSDNTQWGTALIKYLLGDKAGANKLITGGDIETKIIYDNDGGRLEKTTNQLGQTINVMDMKTGKLISPQEYADRNVGFSAFADTMAGKSAAEATVENTKSLLKNQGISNAWSAASPELGRKFNEIDSNLKDIQSQKGDIPADIFSKIMGFATSAQGNANSQSAGTTALDQMSKNAGFRSGESIGKTLSSAWGVDGVWKFTGEGTIKNDKGETKNIGELRQATDTTNKSSETTKNFNSIREDILKSELLSKMSPDLQKKLLRTLELTNDVSRTNSELTNKFGVPAFLSLPSAFNVESKLAQGRAQAAQGMFNTEAMDAFKAYYNEAIKSYPKSQVPGSNEIEANFVKTPEYKKLQAKYSSIIKDVINETPKEAPVSVPKASSAAVPSAVRKQPPTVGKAPPSAIPSGYTLIGKTPEGKSVYRTAEGKQVVEQ